MKDSIKNYLGIAGIIALVATAIGILSYTATYSRSTDPASLRSFSVQGTGTATVIPDIAQVSASVVTEGDLDIGSITTTNTTKMNSIISSIKDNSVEEKDIKTTAYSIEPRRQYYSCPRVPSVDGVYAPCPPAKIIGYTITQSITIKIRDFTKIGTILSEITDAGANNVSGPYFTLDDPDMAQNEARKEAIEKAENAAREIAHAGGFSLGKILSINDGYYPSYRYQDRALDTATFSSESKSAPTPAIEPGSQDVTITVSLQYEIK